jgi:putative phage-type endonuclease|tara:strand:+ start:115 stop:1527 length:1413 start_codon:yes stop_codon:yes gene_type:complete
MITNDFLENIMFTLDEMANTITAESECDIDIAEPTIETDDEDLILDNNIMDQLTSEDVGEIIQYIYELLDEYYQENLVEVYSPTFIDTLCKDVAYILFEEWSSAEICIEDDYENILSFVKQIFELYEDIITKTRRSRSYTFDTLITMDETLKQTLNTQISYLRGLPQPEQRTPEWYSYRNNLITASNLWKVFGSQAQCNSLIYEKCNIGDEMGAPRNFSGINSPMHWGVKYEPVTVMIYEHMYDATIEEFGCIQHPEYKFIGASPDGININENSLRYGRMLEIKNIFNREITGIPKKEYWVQTQIQMETCNLDKCDFMETRFKEFGSEDEFYNDTDKREYKGIILHFIPRELSIDFVSPIYEYMPLSIEMNKETMDAWIQEKKDEKRKDGQVLFTTLYWYLDEYSCVLIERNTKWFETAVKKIKEVWDIVLNERVDGYQHRAPKKRVPKQIVPKETLVVVKKGDDLVTEE